MIPYTEHRNIITKTPHNYMLECCNGTKYDWDLGEYYYPLHCEGSLAVSRYANNFCTGDISIIRAAERGPMKYSPILFVGVLAVSCHGLKVNDKLKIRSTQIFDPFQFKSSSPKLEPAFESLQELKPQHLLSLSSPFMYSACSHAASAVSKTSPSSAANMFDPSQFQPVCPASDGLYGVLKGNNNQIITA